MAFRLIVSLLVLGAFALAGCSSDHEHGEVQIHGNTYDPGTLTVQAGQEVHFVNHDGVAHTATSDTGAFDTGNIAGGATGDARFDGPGTFSYHCKIHPSMKGTIVVQ
ncbi:MAG TPA: cupredoxin domain-containing protein [Candidatus Thermoplasmatota archaeon]|nr:cupredoxin domain-containing protein [Candidatus Thermoplasmatota archaeon]